MKPCTYTWSGTLAARELEHRRPEQRVKVDDVLADEVDLLGVAVAARNSSKLRARHCARLAAVEVVLERTRDSRSARRATRRNTCRARPGSGCRSRARRARCPSRRAPARPAARTIRAPCCATCGCSRPGALEPALQELDALRIGEPEEVVLGALAHRRGARQRRVRIDQVGRRVDGAAVLAGIAVLILRMADRAFALDVAIRQEHLLHRVVELLDRLAVDQARRLELAVDVAATARRSPASASSASGRS